MKSVSARYVSTTDLPLVGLEVADLTDGTNSFIEADPDGVVEVTKAQHQDFVERHQLAQGLVKVAEDKPKVKSKEGESS